MSLCTSRKQRVGLGERAAVMRSPGTVVGWFIYNFDYLISMAMNDDYDV